MGFPCKKGLKMKHRDTEPQRKIRFESRIYSGICNFRRKLSQKLKNFKCSGSLRLCGENSTFFQTRVNGQLKFVRRQVTDRH